MMQTSKHYSEETYRTLRNCRLLESAVDSEGVGFIRCIPRAMSYGEDGNGWKLSAKLAGERARRVAAEVNEVGVFWAHHPDHGDYVRVNRNTATFRLICWMAS